jgi:hypothetical protein
MSVRSTVELTRKEAEERWIAGMLELRRRELEMLVQCQNDDGIDDGIEGDLEAWNDRDNPGAWGTGFENYRITNRP